MNRKLMLIMTRPSDNSLEAFVTFRNETALKLKESKTVLIKDDVVNEWEKFWSYINKTPNRKICIGNYLN